MATRSTYSYENGTSNRYRQRCPPQMSLNRYQPYKISSKQQSPTSEECVNTLSKMNHRVSEEGFYIPSPAVLSTNPYFNFHPVNNNQQLPPCSPLTPSCAYYNTGTPSFTYPQDHLPPTSIFTASLAQGLLEEEAHKDQLDDVQPQTRSYDIASILSLPQQKREVKTFDLFDKVVDYQDPPIHDLYRSVMNDDLMTMTRMYQQPEEHEMNKMYQQSKDHGMDRIYQQPEDHEMHRMYQQPQENEIQKESAFLPNTTATKLQPLNQPKKGHACCYCGKIFQRRSSMVTHERIHTGEKPYHCQYCSKSFSDNSTFVKHVRTHTREKPYSCKTCGKSFAQSGNLHRHEKLHL